MQVARAGTQRQQSEGAGNEAWWWQCVPGGLDRLTRRTLVPRSGHILLDLSERVLRKPHWPLLTPCSLTVEGKDRSKQSTCSGDWRETRGGCQWPGLLTLPHSPSEAGVWMLLGRVAPPFPDAGPPQPILPVSCPSSSPPSQPI